MKKHYITLMYLLICSNIALALPARTLVIAVATNFESTFKELTPLFKAQYNITVNPAFGSTGKLYTQIINGAPFDIFLSGDKEHILLLEKKGLAIPTTRFNYAIGSLILYAPEKKISEHGLTKKIASDIQHIAIANPMTAPYGHAAMEYIKLTGLLPILKNKLIIGENIGQVATFLITQNVDIGFIANSQLIDMMKQSKNYIRPEEIWKVPPSMYAPLRQYATMIETSHAPQEAKAFVSFLKSPDAKKIIMNHGYHFEK